jgi:type I restriction enzyme S subunit
MREMKDSRISWINQIPENWNVEPIKYSYRLIAGATPESTNVDFWDGDIKWITPADFKTKDVFVMGGSRNLTIEGYKSCSTSMLPIGSIVFSKRAPIGTVAITADKLCTNQGCLGLVEKSDRVLNKFYFYVISIYGEVFNLYGSGTTFKEISANTFANIKLPMPPIQEQKHIVNFLDAKCAEIDALTADIQTQIDSLEQYKRSIISEAVTKGLNPDVEMKDSGNQYWGSIPTNWHLSDIKYLFEIVKRNAGKEGYDILSVTQKGIKIKDISNNEGQVAESYANYQFVYPGDFVMNHMDLLTGWVDCSNLFGVTSPDYRVFRLRDKNNSLSYYKYIMQTCYMNRIFYSLGQGVSNLGRWRLQTSSFNNFMVPVPPVEVQESIATYLDKKCTEINICIDDKQRQLEVLEEYKKSLIYEYVTGKKEVPAI